MGFLHSLFSRPSSEDCSALVHALLADAEALGLGPVDVDNAREMMRYNEKELCFDIIANQFHSYDLEITPAFYELSQMVVAVAEPGNERKIGLRQRQWTFERPIEARFGPVLKQRAPIYRANAGFCNRHGRSCCKWPDFNLLMIGYLLPYCVCFISKEILSDKRGLPLECLASPFLRTFWSCPV